MGRVNKENKQCPFSETEEEEEKKAVALSPIDGRRGGGRGGWEGNFSNFVI